MNVIHDSRRIEYRSPFGAVAQGTAVTLCADIFCAPGERMEALQLILQAEPADGSPWSAVLSPERIEGHRAVFLLDPETLLNAPGLYFYSFRQRSDDQQETAEDRNQITVYPAGLTVPRWFLDSVIYQIFPDRFFVGGAWIRKPGTFYYGSWFDLPMYIKDARGEIIRHDFFGGNLWGIAEKMDYIRRLGADVIYLNPIFTAASNHRYDTCDYYAVDPVLGGEEAFDAMIAAGREHGIRFILDGVFSHTGNDSIYFDRFRRYGAGRPASEQGAYGNPASKYRAWYRFGQEDDDYECWWGVKALPNVNEMEPGYLDYILRGPDSVIRHWGRKGISGWRLDVADELPDAFIALLRQTAEESMEEPVVIGEVWEDASNKISYGHRRTYYTAPELHSNTNYVFRSTLLAYFSGEITGRGAMERFLELHEHCPVHNFYALVNMTGSHDVERLMTCMRRAAAKDCRSAEAMVKCYAMIQFSFPGVPLIYYGDETGLEGGIDPDNRRTYPWGRENEELVAWFAMLAELRRTYSVLRRGYWSFSGAEADILSFDRYYADGRDVFGEAAPTCAQTAFRVLINRCGGEIAESDYSDLPGYEVAARIEGYGLMIKYLK